MTDIEPNLTDSNERFIQVLVADLTPVARLRAPLVRALVWLGVVVATAAVLSVFSDVSAAEQRLTAAPDMWLAVAGSALTVLLAAVATFQLSFPDRSPVWALLPMPACLLWVGASGMGCLRAWIIPGAHDASIAEASRCFLFILGFSIPLSLLLFAMLRRAYSLRPYLTAAIGGMAVAAASATLLNFFHPYDASATDLVVHAVAVGIVVAASATLGGRTSHGARMHLYR